MTFFSITLISTYVEPLSRDPRVLEIFAHLGSSIWLAILAGAVFTILVQSSAVTSGLILTLSALGTISFPIAIGMILGANVGTTATALIASINMNDGAKKASIAHFLFNVIGTIIILPILVPFMNFVQNLGGEMPQQIANAHMIFNIFSVIVAIILVRPFSWLVEFVYHLLPKKS
jgi:phosphate:Na+ symporter